MALESFFRKENLNIKDLALEKEKEPILESKKIYDALKETKLYDKEKKQWNSFMNERQILEHSDRESESQLLGVLAEALFDKQSAKSRYAALKMTPFFDIKQKQWNNALDKDQKLIDTKRTSLSQLLSILTQALSNEQSAKFEYEVLKKSRLYDSKRGQWERALSENQELNPLLRQSGSQLVGILAEALFDKQSAKTQYEALKESEFYDPEKNQWNDSINGDTQKLQNSGRHASDQLLGVLVEALFDKDLAKSRYETLKKTKLYDPAKKQWNDLIGENQGLVISSRSSDSQLVGVLAENLFEEKNFDKKSEIPPRPEKRSY